MTLVIDFLKKLVGSLFEMISTIKVGSKIFDTIANMRKQYLKGVGFSGIQDVRLVDVYTIDVEVDDLETIVSMLVNPVTQWVTLDEVKDPKNFDWAIEIGFLPGVTDNVGNTVREEIGDLLGGISDSEGVYTSQINFLSGDLTREQVDAIAKSLANPLIQRIHVKSYDEFIRSRGMGVVVPKVRISEQPKADLVDILNVSDDELVIIGKQGIANYDGSRRGPLALDLTYMKAIQNYFKREERNPTDVELESIAQTWSEHCKHTIFADPMDDIEGGLFRCFIKSATERIMEKRGREDFCVSVFKDNSGAIVFDEDYLITDKAETHNSPSALDPFGGAITGIVGVNRDTIGFGLGAKPVINRYGFCFADPDDKKPLYKGKGKTQNMLSPRMIMNGIIDGVNVGGNCSGIPTTQGFVYFDERYKGKPLVFVGTVGLIPKVSFGRIAHEKVAQPGDNIVMIGGRVGKDGIHGATFSSEALDSGSPATAVQIGDPITQKKLSDAVVKEARDLGLYNSITDNGAGGLSCSVAEMAKECGGCLIDLGYVPLKYAGLKPWEIWISESQERMTLAVPDDKLDRFLGLMEKRGVEAIVVGEFTDSGRCIVDYSGKRVMDVDMDFLHNGLPPRRMKTSYTKQVHDEPDIPVREDLTDSLHFMLGRLNIASFEFISQQYDHEVQGGSVIKPLQGRGRVNGDATVVRPRLDSQKGVVVSQGINPNYSDIDTYHMAACAIDSAIRNAIAVGADLEHLALMDNFCWCSSDEPERLGQLKRAAMACYDYAVLFETPFISGKDSMFNDFKGYDDNGNAVKISVPPTLLVSSIGVMDDVNKAVSLDAKFSGDKVYVLGDTLDELGGSEYFSMVGEHERGERYVGNNVPKVNAEKNKRLYETLFSLINEELVASVQAVGRGGLGVALAKTAMGGKMGMDVSFVEVSDDGLRDDFILYSESQGRFVVTVAEKNSGAFKSNMGGNNFVCVGRVRNDDSFIIQGKNGKEVIKTNIGSMLGAYRSRFEGY